MKHIQEYVLAIDEELEGAKEYAEKALYWKYEGNTAKYKSYNEMANDELKHVNLLHTMAVEDVAKLKEKGYNPTERMQAMWDKSHKDYVEQTAFIRQMLTM